MIALVLRPQMPPTEPPETPHFVDGTLRTIGARLVPRRQLRLRPSPPHLLVTIPPSFLLRCRATRRRLGGPYPAGGARIGSRRPERNSQWARLPVEDPRLTRFGGSTCPTICVDVAPADTLTLELWSKPNTRSLSCNPSSPQLPRALRLLHSELRRF